MTDQYKFMCKLFKDLTQDLKDRLGYVFKIQHRKNCYEGYDFDPENYNKLEVKFENMEVDFEHNCYQLDKTGFSGNPWSNSTSPLEDVFVSFRFDQKTGKTQFPGIEKVSIKVEDMANVIKNINFARVFDELIDLQDVMNGDPPDMTYGVAQALDETLKINRVDDEYDSLIGQRTAIQAKIANEHIHFLFTLSEI